MRKPRDRSKLQHARETVRQAKTLGRLEDTVRDFAEKGWTRRAKKAQRAVDQARITYGLPVTTPRREP